MESAIKFNCDSDEKLHSKKSILQNKNLQVEKEAMAHAEEHYITFAIQLSIPGNAIPAILFYLFPVPEQSIGKWRGK